MKGGSCPPSAAGSAASDALENLDADGNQDHRAENRQRDRKNRLDSAESVIGNRAESGAESSHDRISSSLNNYPLPLKILVAMATAARIPYIAEHTRKPAEKPNRNISGKSD